MSSVRKIISKKILRKNLNPYFNIMQINNVLHGQYNILLDKYLFQNSDEILEELPI